MKIQNNYKSMTAARELLAARQRIKAAKENEKKARKSFAITILEDAIAEPSRILRIDQYWRTTGLTPMDVEGMIVRAIQDTEDPEFMGLKTTRTVLRRRYAEFDEQGNPTGNVIERTEETPVIVNLGAVKMREGDTREAPLGTDNLLSPSKLCKPGSCYYMKKGQKCPDADSPTKWRCNGNYNVVQSLINKILNRA